MRERSFELRTKDNLILSGYDYLPESDDLIVGLVILVHGRGEYGRRYAHVAERFVERGYVFSTCDHRGHGRSEGKKGDGCLSKIRSDVDLMIENAGKRYKSTPVFLYGHSMGGALVLRWSFDSNSTVGIDGIITTSPWLKLTEPLGFLNIYFYIVKLLVLFWPSLTLKTTDDPEKLSRIEANMHRWRRDPLIHPFLTVRLLVNFVENGIWALRNAHRYSRAPLLLIHGSRDDVCDVKATKQFYEKAKDNPEVDCDFHVFEGGFHELHNDICGEQHISLMVKWVEKIRARLSSK